MELLWAGVREGLKAVRAPGVATLVLLDRCSMHFPPILRGRGARGYCSLLEPPPLRGVGIPLFLFSPMRFSSLWPLALHLLLGGAPIQCCGRYFGNTWKRLSATDISALVTMKNVAKCDT